MPEKEKDSLAWVRECIDDSNKQLLENDWEKIQYFRNGQMLLWQDRTGRWFPIMCGVSYDGLYFDAESLINYPKDAHMVTLDTGLMAKALGNPLIPEVVPAGNDDTDRDTAEKCTNFLRYHRQEVHEDRQTAGRSLREQACDYILGTGNAFLKDYFDPYAGDKFEVDDQVLFQGRIVTKVVSPRAIRTPNGQTNWDEIPWIIEETAVHIDEAKKLYPRSAEEITADEDLADPNAITPWAGSGGGRGDGMLKDHVLIYELYERPSEANGHKGRKIIATKTTLLWEGVYDQKLAASRFGSRHWHPYSYAGWRKVSGSMWCKTLLEELIPLQIKLNSLWQILTEEDPDFRGWWLTQEGSVDWEMVRTSYNTYGVNVIEYSQGARMEPKFVAPVVKNPDIMGKIQLCIARMNDIVAQYETTRGNSDPSVTSGKQADIMNSQSNTQATPLLTAVVNLFIQHWQKVLQLAAVHFDQAGVEINYSDPIAGGVVNDTFTPDMIQSDDVAIFGGNAFYMTPDAKRDQIQQLGQAGFFGDIINDPVAKQKYLKLLELPFFDSVFADETLDIEAAKRENNRFGQFKLQEDRPWILQALQQQFAMESAAWLQAKVQFDSEKGQFDKDMANFQTLGPLWERAEQERQMTMQGSAKTGAPLPEDIGPAPIMPMAPMDPGPAPQMPPLYWRAQDFEEHVIHIAEHNRWRKTRDYEKLCRQNPELDAAIAYHVSTHEEFMQTAMMSAQAMMTPPGSDNMGQPVPPAVPPPAGPGQGAV